MKFDQLTEEVLADLENQRLENWNIDRESAVFLYNTVIEVEPRKIVEFGTSTGYSTIWLAKAVEAAVGGEVLTIESHQIRFEKAQESFKKLNLHSIIKQIKGHAPKILNEYVEDLKDGVDAVFLDLIKKDYKACLEFIFPYLKIGAVIVADNIISHQHAVGEFLDYVKSHPQIEGEVVDIGTGMYVGKKLQIG